VTASGSVGLPSVLVINGGSSSIRFALYSADASLQRGIHGKIERIGLDRTALLVDDSAGKQIDSRPVAAADHAAAASLLIHWLEENIGLDGVHAIGHRVVHGMQHAQPMVISAELLQELRRISPSDPDHLPGEIALIEVFASRCPSLLQLACFDTTFHHHMPRVARLLAIPRRYQDQGIWRYGFHGLSYAYLIEELRRLGDPAASSGRVILAHLGSGASLAALRDGLSIDTSMGFTPASGIPMGTRCGDIDPGLASYLSRSEGMSTAQFHDMVNHQSGLLGVSGISSDIRDLLAHEHADASAADALSLFCYEVRKCIGAYAAALGGLDTLVFSGGIGENAAQIRMRICEGLRFLGIELQPQKNARHAALISADGGRVAVRIIRTNEELMIARALGRQLGWLPRAQAPQKAMQ